MDEQLKSKYWSKRLISRRSLVRGAVIGGAGLAGASLLGCNVLDGDSGGTDGSKGGTLRSAPDIELSTTDPAFFTSDAEAAIGWQAGENLVVKQHDLSITGGVAESWETPDQQEYTFKLRKNNKWHDGESVTAEDVKFTFDRIFAMDAPPAGQLGSLAAGTTEVVDDNTVKMTLEAPNAFWLNTLSFYQGKIAPQHDDPTNWGIGKYVGSGPFKMTSNVPGETTTFERNTDYWDSGNTYFDNIQFFYLPEPETRIESLKGGQIDQVNRITAASVPEVDASPNSRASKATSASYMTLAMNTLIAPFNDIRVRQAVQAATNREQNLSKVLEGLGAVANDHPIAPNDPHYDSGVAIPGYDLQKARDLLAAAGYADGLDVPVTTMGATYHEEIALTFQEYSRDAGFNVTIDKKPEDEYWSKWWLNREDVQMLTVNWNGRNPDAALSIVYHGDAPWNETFHQDDALDALIERARGEGDDDRKATYSSIQKHLVEQAYRVIPVFASTLMGVGTNVRNIEAHPSRWPFLSRGWFEEA